MDNKNAEHNTKENWDYSNLAKAYIKRADYSKAAIDEMIGKTQLSQKQGGFYAADIGAGVAHLTLHIARENSHVSAVEPNDAMRELGIERTSQYNNIIWHKGSAEETGLENSKYHLISFGSSFNVCDRSLALKEVKRIAVENAWFTAMWNHRDLTDSIQQEIESIISHHIRNYDYGVRRKDQTEFLERSGYFQSIEVLDGKTDQIQKKSDLVEAWLSHATLERQAGGKFKKIVKHIEQFITDLQGDTIIVPYTTKVWLCQLKK